jgi:hypothetical protein
MPGVWQCRGRSRRAESTDDSRRACRPERAGHPERAHHPERAGGPQGAGHPGARSGSTEPAGARAAGSEDATAAPTEAPTRTEPGPGSKAAGARVDTRRSHRSVPVAGRPGSERIPGSERPGLTAGPGDIAAEREA